MCGVFAYLARRDGKLNLRKLEGIAVDTERRGPHAFGFAWIDSLGRLHCYKQTGKVSQHLGLLAMARDARLLIGHCRYATHGDCTRNVNNHPHPADGGWLVHNGVLHGYGRLVAEHDLHPVSECDSEALGLLIERERGTLIERCRSAVDTALADSDGPFAMLALWARPGRLVIARRGNPLHWSNDPEGYYFASLAGALAKPQAFPDGKVGLFTGRDVKYARLHRAEQVGSAGDWWGH